jgi:hypothetical protein
MQNTIFLINVKNFLQGLEGVFKHFMWFGVRPTTFPVGDMHRAAA